MDNNQSGTEKFDHSELIPRIIRNFSVKIIEIEKKISKADRVKALNYENKYLYGAKIKETSKKQLKEHEVSADNRDKDLSSEIYWTCLHVPEVDFTKRKKKPKKKAKTTSEIGKSLVKKFSAGSISKAEINDKKTEQREETEILNSHSNVQKVPMSQSREPMFAAKETNSKIQTEEEASDEESNKDGSRIPFKRPQLRAIFNFPMYLSNELTINTFESFVKTPPAISFPSVSKVLQATMPKAQRNALIMWKNQKILELGLKGFELLQQSHFDRGKQFHKCLQNYFQGETVVKSELEPEVLEIWNSIDPLLHKFKTPGVLIEEKVKHPYLLYQGIVDCVSYQNSSLCVIEWKKSDSYKKSIDRTFDAPIQVASYLGALNASREEFREKPIKHGVVVVAYNDGHQADVFELNEKKLDQYWRIWLGRLQEYWVRLKDNTLPDPI